MKKLIILFIFASCSVLNLGRFYSEKSLLQKEGAIKGRVKVKITKVKKHWKVVGSADTCYLEWRFINGIIDNKNFQCMSSLYQARAIMKKMIDAIVKKTGTSLAIKGFYTNSRLLTDLEKRINLHLANSNDWDSIHGTGIGVTTNKLIVDYANESEAWFEISEVFDEYCLDTSITKISKPSIVPATGLSYYSSLRKEKVSRRALLPADYFIDFAFNAKSDSCK